MPLENFLPLALQLDQDQPIRFVYLKQHHGSDAPQSWGCTPFVTGLPFCHNQAETFLRELFSNFGDVECVILHPTEVSAVVGLKQPEGWERIEKASSSGKVLTVSIPLPEECMGLKGWVQRHKRQFVGNNTLKQQLDDWIALHEVEMRKRAEAAENADDGGWTVVRHKGGRKKTTDKTGIAVGAVASAVAQARFDEKKPKVLHDFYKFQQRNKRHSEIMELQDKFQSDKRRIAELKAARRFKPY